jgi:cyclomaltodextrinase / maltogenic alpha-amylase / neopullulanase
MVMKEKRPSFAVIVSAALLAAACTGNGGGGSESGSEATPIRFDMQGGDSFAPTERLYGEAECDDVSLLVNDEPARVPVDVNGTSFVADVPLAPGGNEVVAICRSGDLALRSEPLMFTRRVPVGPTAVIEVTVSGSTVMLDGTKSTPSEGSRLQQYRWSAGGRRVARDPQGPLDTAGGRRFSRARGPRLALAAPAEDGEYFVTLEVSDATGDSDTSITYFVVEGGRARAVDLVREHPSWIDKAVIYAPIPQLWGNGGTKSVHRRLAYLRDLGVDALWLWPPTTLRTPGEEYAIDDYFELDPLWRPEKAFKAMVDEAHRLGLYVLSDFVPNHMSAQSPYYRDTEERGELSIYWDFFDRKPEGKPTHYFDWTHLPNLNYENREVRTMIMQAFSHWVRDLGIDGFRVDVAWGIKRRRPDFWLGWRQELKRINPDLLLIAEASAVDPYYFSHGFDVAYDWTRELGHWAWESAFEFPQEAGVLLETALTNGGKGYAKDALIMRFLNNNDTGVRFVHKYSPDLTRVAATLQFTIPGTPAMFGGDEIGANYEPYSNLTPILWKDTFGLRPLYKRLIELKHTIPALSSRRMELLRVDTNSTLAYLRPAVDESGPVLVILNFGSKAPVRVSGPAAFDSLLSSTGGRMRDLVTGDTVELEGGRIKMPAESSLVLVPGTN